MLSELRAGLSLERISVRYGVPVGTLRALVGAAPERPNVERRPVARKGRPTSLDASPMAAGLSYRRLDYWTRLGYLRAENPAPGSGYRRRWADGEIEVARRMLALTAAGITPATAAEIARRPVGAYGLCEGYVLLVFGETAPEIASDNSFTRRPAPPDGSPVEGRAG